MVPIVHRDKHSVCMQKGMGSPWAAPCLAQGTSTPALGWGLPDPALLSRTSQDSLPGEDFWGNPAAALLQGMEFNYIHFISLSFFFFPSDWHKLCLQLRFLRISSPRITMALINHLLPGLLIFSFLPCIFWLEFQSEVGTQTASKPQCTAHYPKKHCCNYRQAHSKSPHGGSSMHSPDQKQPCRKGHWVK